MKTGTKSLLFGVHQFIWHPFTVYLAWRKLNGPPSWRELVCIIIHDWGYWGCDKMDDAKGELHPMVGAKLARRWLDGKQDGLCETCRNGQSTSCFGGCHYGKLVLLHSRHLAKRLYQDPSKLCWPDKYSIIYEPAWWYLLRARLSGELAEYRDNGAKYIPLWCSDKEWFLWVKSHLKKAGQEKIPAGVSPAKEGV